jgi:hypothetical protein
VVDVAGGAENDRMRHRLPALYSVSPPPTFMGWRAFRESRTLADL